MPSPPRLGHVDRAVGQRRAADRVQRQRQDLVLDHAQRRGDAPRRGQLGMVALAVVEAQRMAVEALRRRAIASTVAESSPPDSSTTALRLALSFAGHHRPGSSPHSSLCSCS